MKWYPTTTQGRTSSVPSQLQKKLSLPCRQCHHIVTSCTPCTPYLAQHPAITCISAAVTSACMLPTNLPYLPTSLDSVSANNKPSLQTRDGIGYAFAYASLCTFSLRIHVSELSKAYRAVPYLPALRYTTKFLLQAGHGTVTLLIGLHAKSSHE